jgi:formate dehydrogenase maturation protein FdhE
MCKEETAIKVLKKFEKQLKEKGWDTRHFEIAYQAIEKQIPQQFDKENDFNYCPVCGKGGNTWDKPRYCQYCGQSLKP